MIRHWPGGKTGKLGWHGWGLAGMMLLLLAGGLLLWPSAVLQVSGSAGKVWLRIPIRVGEQFEVTFTHSMYHVPQTEVYRVGQAGDVILQQTEFGSYAAAEYYDGLIDEHHLTWSGDKIIEKAGEHAVFPFRQYLGTSESEFRLAVGGRTFKLAKYLDPPGQLTIRVIRGSAASALVYGLLSRN